MQISVKAYVGIFIFLAGAYLLFMEVFILAIFIIIIYVIYRITKASWMSKAPAGKRIKHGMLRGHLSQQYGTKEGNKVYKEMVKGLRDKGYR